MNFLGLIQVLFTLTVAQIACTETHADESYPFLVKIETKGKFLVCAGTILTPCIVLTSAHCVDGVKPSDVIVNQVTDRPTRYDVAAIEIHPDYNSLVLANDIALLQVKHNFREPWAAVTLNSLDKDKVFPQCNHIQILGWSGNLLKDQSKTDQNATVSEKPIRANVRLISKENCSSLIKNYGGVFQGEEKLCGETEEVGCSIGPGGPLLCSVQAEPSQEPTTKKAVLSKQTDLTQVQQVDKKETLAEPIDLLENLRNLEEKKFKREAQEEVKNLQLGVVSWGKGCSKVPSVYIKTDYYYNWIIKTTKGMSEKCEFCGLFTYITPLGNGGTTIKDFAIFNVVIISVSITALLRFLDHLFYFTVLP